MTDLINNPGNWTDAFFPAPSNFDRKAYQKQLDEVCGTVRGGHSIVHVVFGSEEEIEVDKQFTLHGSSAERVTVGRHRTRVKGVPGKVRKRRWIFEEWQPPEQIPDEGFVHMPGAGGLYLPPHVAQEKLQGKWLEIYIVADHSSCDSEVCNSFEHFCFGKYRHPNEYDLQKFRKLNYRKKALALDAIDPFEPISESRVARFNKEAIETVEELEREQDEHDRAFYADAQKTLSRSTTNG